MALEKTAHKEEVRGYERPAKGLEQQYSGML
jgi:hypothetical protein